jgi:hypothetical protein
MRWLMRAIVGLVVAAAFAFAVLLPSGFTCPEGSALLSSGVSRRAKSFTAAWKPTLRTASS